MERGNCGDLQQHNEGQRQNARQHETLTKLSITTQTRLLEKHPKKTEQMKAVQLNVQIKPVKLRDAAFDTLGLSERF